MRWRLKRTGSRLAEDVLASYRMLSCRTQVIACHRTVDGVGGVGEGVGGVDEGGCVVCGVVGVAVTVVLVSVVLINCGMLRLCRFCW